MKILIAAASFVFLIAASATPSDACQRNVSRSAGSILVPESRIDQSLLDAAIRAEVNFHRCRAGLGAVAYGGSTLTSIANTHSSWMAKTKKLSHFNTIRGLKSLGERVEASGIDYRTASENIVKVHRYQLDNRRFKTIDRGQCRFAANGVLVSAHSYASLARHAVDLWMKSPAHRQNILSPKVNRMVVGVAYAPTRKYCGEFWLTQNFVG